MNHKYYMIGIFTCIASQMMAVELKSGQSYVITNGVYQGSKVTIEQKIEVSQQAISNTQVYNIVLGRIAQQPNEKKQVFMNEAKKGNWNALLEITRIPIYLGLIAGEKKYLDETWIENPTE